MITLLVFVLFYFVTRVGLSHSGSSRSVAVGAKKNWLRLAVSSVLGALFMAISSISAVEAAGTVAFANGRSIDALANGVMSVVAADIDSDGDLDVVSAMFVRFAVTVFWYENLDGQGTFAAGVAVAEDIEQAAA